MTDELAAEAKAASDAKAVYEEHLKNVRGLLLRARLEKGTPVVELERLIGRLYDRGTISRLTAEAAGTARKKPARGSRKP